MQPIALNRRGMMTAAGLALVFRPSAASAQNRAPKGHRFIDGRTEFGSFVEADGKAVVDGEVHEGVELQVALPESQHVKNFGAPRDNKGLCVFASMTMCARWHNVRPLFNVIKQIQEGGGWPEKVDAVFKEYAPGLKYVQYEGTDPSILDKALSSGSPACVTYGYGERYASNGRMETIYHMVLLVHLDNEWAAILDNNFPGARKYEWMPRAEFLKRWVHPSGKGWAYVMLAPPPPPVPHN